MALPRINLDLTHEERLPSLLLLIFFVLLCFAGGASREDVVAQTVIRGGAVLLMLVQVIAGRFSHFNRYKACFLLMGGMFALAALQLVPLPPAIWTMLPGRFVISASPIGAQSWRPINLVPDAGWNAFFSLIVPLCALVLLSALEPRTVRRVRYLLIGAVVASCVVALLQAVGSAPDNGLINGSSDDYAGIFANHNHQALFLAIGIALVWFWGFEKGGSWRDRRSWLAVALVLLLSVSILVTGSRGGAIVGAMALVFGLTLANVGGKREVPRSKAQLLIWVLISLVVLGGVLAISLYFDRAQSLDRAARLGVGEDFRLVALPTVWHLAKMYFPIGAGLGSFDAVFRIAEPFGLLKPTYFNHAHDDFLETVVETGIFGPAIFLAAVGWLCWGARSAMTADRGSVQMARLAYLIVVMIAVASIVDYPARTPMIMVVLAIVGCWITDASAHRLRINDALPVGDNSL